MDILKLLRTPKLFQIAIFDVSATLLIAYLIAIRFHGNVIKYMIASIFLGIIVHWSLGINTMLNYYLGLSAKP
mgnify:CR=1 FL=1